MLNARINQIAFIPILALLFSACAPSASTTEIPPEASLAASTTAPPAPTHTPFPTEEIIKGTISIRHSWDETNLPTLAAIIKTFQSYYPDVLFDVLSIPADSLLDYHITESGKGTQATILLGPAEWEPVLFENGLIADLSASFSPEILARLNQPALKASYLDGKLLSLPYSVSGVVLYRNNEIITLAPNTFDELVSLAQASTQGSIIGAYLERSFYYSGAHLLGLGGQLKDENNLPGFNNGTGVEWLQLLRNFEQAGPVCYFSDDDLDRFKLGQVGWIIAGTWNMSELIAALGADNLAVDPWPRVGSGQMSGFVRSENIYLSSKASGAERSAALKFIQFLIASEAQTRLGEIGQIPANQHVFLSDQVRQRLVGEAILALNSGSAYPADPDMELYNLNLDLALRAYFDDNLAPEQALQTAQDGILSMLNSVQETAVP